MIDGETWKAASIEERLDRLRLDLAAHQVIIAVLWKQMLGRVSAFDLTPDTDEPDEEED